LTDFKEPLDVLNNINPTDSKEEIINTVRITSFKILNIVMNMLDVYKYNRHEILLNKSLCNVEQLLNRSLIKFNSVFGKKNIIINTSCSTDFYIRIDENLIERVLGNVLDTFTENVDEKSIIDISLGKLNNEKLIIRISFLGGYFSRLKITHFINILNNLDTKKSNDYSDMLSLSFCKMVIEAHGGEIWFEFDEKQNPVLCITLASESQNDLSVNDMCHPKPNTDYESIIISDHEKKQMSKYYQSLQETKLFEITKLKLMIAELEKDKRINPYWLSELKVSVKEMDVDKYLYLSKMIKPNK